MLTGRRPNVALLLYIVSLLGHTPVEAGTYKTSKGRDVSHCHIQPCFSRELTAPEVKILQDALKRDYPGVTETAPPTRQYNCHGFAHANFHGWFSDPQMFMDDDYQQMTMINPKVNDVVVYMKNGVHTHSATVRAVSNDKITSLESKWGQWSKVVHGLKEVPAGYGDPIYLLRRKVAAMTAEPSSGKEISATLNGLVEPDKFALVMLASSASAAQVIIMDIPGVRTIIELGPSVASELVSLFRDKRVQENEYAASIMLVMLSNLRSDEIGEMIRTYLLRDDLSEITTQLAVDAYLKSKGVNRDEFILDATVSAIRRERNGR